MTVNRNPAVMDLVYRAIRANPDVSNRELQKQATEIDPSIGELSPRSFNARYPLQVRRKLSQEEGSTKPQKNSRITRSHIRDTLIAFAKEVVEAEDRGEVVEVVESVDEHVDRVMGLVSGSDD